LNVEALSTKINRKITVGMDLGSIRLNGFDIVLFGTPGLLRFKVMRDVVASGSDGIIFIFDASQPDKDENAIVILNSLRKLLKSNIPIVFLANKQDIKGARAPELIKLQNNLPEDCKIFPTSTITGLNLKESLKYIVNEIFDNYSELLHVLRSYESNIKGLATKLDKNKGEMRDFLNSLEVKRFIEIDRLKKTYKVKSGLRALI